jgi:hypothetical protein
MEAVRMGPGAPAPGLFRCGAWAMFRGLLSLTDEKFAMSARDVALYMP